MALSIDNKGLIYQLKLFKSQNNFQDLLFSGQTAFKSIDGEQFVRETHLAPGESLEHTSIGENSHPTTLFIRAADGILLAEMEVQHLVAEEEYISTGLPRATVNLDLVSDLQELRFEIFRMFLWTGSFSTITLTNPADSGKTIQLFLIEG